MSGLEMAAQPHSLVRVVLREQRGTAKHQPRGEEDIVKVRITREELVEKPVSPLIYGNFVESGLGRQVEGMWAEMFFNRSFERVPPYTEAQRGAAGCTPDEDRTIYPFWHSGYEENAWYLAPGNADAAWSPSLHVSFHHGQQSGWLKNDSADKWAGFAQSGLVLRKGERYTFSGWMKTGKFQWDLHWGDLTLDAELRIYRESDWTKPLITQTVRGITKAFERYEWTFACDAFEGRATFSVWIPPKSSLFVDDFSLMPASNLDGWRADVVEAGRRVNAPIIRWPGGCFASRGHRPARRPRPDRELVLGRAARQRRRHGRVRPVLPARRGRAVSLRQHDDGHGGRGRRVGGLLQCAGVAPGRRAARERRLRRAVRRAVLGA
jgi:hypothetical protein